MSEAIKSAIESELAKVSDPELHRPITELGMVERIEFNDGLAEVSILLTITGCPMRDRLQKDVSEATLKVAEVKNVKVNFGVMNDA
jgi:ATP-binding protein involved in chromosome partitioning